MGKTTRIAAVALALGVGLATVPTNPAAATPPSYISGDGDGRPATWATVGSPTGPAFDSLGNMYFADYSLHEVRKVDKLTGIITTVVRNSLPLGLNPNPSAAGQSPLSVPLGIALDAQDNLYIADSYNHRIRKVDSITGIITTVAGSGPSGSCCNGGFSGDGFAATNARLAQPSHIAFDAAGNLVFSDSQNHRVRKVSKTTGKISTIAGSGACCGEFGGYSGDGGPATAAKLNVPLGLAYDAAGNLFVADACNNRIRKIDLSGTISTFAGAGALGCGGGGWSLGGYSGDGGPATMAEFNRPVQLAFDGSGGLFVGDHTNHRVRKIDASGIVTTVAGTGSVGFSDAGAAATATRLNRPHGPALDAAGNLYVADSENHRIGRVDQVTGIFTTVVGAPYGAMDTIAGGGPSLGDGGPATVAQLANPTDVVVAPSGDYFIADPSHHRVRRVDTSGIITTIAGTGTAGYAGDGGLATAAQLNGPWQLALDAGGNLLIVDRSSHCVRRVDAMTGIITTIAGSGVAGFAGDGGPATSATLRQPNGVVVDSAGNVFISDFGNRRIRRIDATTGTITTFAGTGTQGSQDGPGTIAQFSGPRGLFIMGGDLYVADAGNNITIGNRIRAVNLALGVVRTIGGRGGGYTNTGDGGPAALADMAYPYDITVDAGANIYLTARRVIRRIDGRTGVITTIAGKEGGFQYDERNLGFPAGIALDAAGDLLIADTDNSRVLRAPL